MEPSFICEIHGQKLEKFCPAHDKTFCNLCTKEDHEMCENIVSIEDIAKDFKSCDAVRDLEKSIEDAKQNIGKAIHSVTETKTSLILVKSSICQEIQILRKELYHQIDKMEMKLLQETEARYKDCVNKLENAMRRHEEDKKDIDKLFSSLEKAKISNSSKHGYLEFRNVNKQFLKTKSKLEVLLTDNKKFEMSVTFDPIVATFRESVTALGKIQIDETSNPIAIQDYKSRQAQVPVNLAVKIPQIKLVGRKQVIPILPELNDHIITSCLILPKGKFIFLHRNNSQLFIQAADGLVLHTLNIASGPYDADIFDDTQLAISFGSLARVEIISINNGKVSRKFSTDGFCSGICCGHECVYVLVKGKGVCKISLTHGLTCLIKLPSFDMGFVDVSTNSLVVSNTKDKSVCCYDLHGNNLWSINLDEGIPRGVQFDWSGNILLIDSKSDTLKQVSRDGQEMRIVLKETDGLNTPFGLYCDRNSKQLLICNLLDGRALLYNCT